ncbi:hypothetical protein D7X96_15125 [Corallococcus interemptor]|uniref:Cytochrome c domain-containing protein n=2 Tax=Corallococcus interemptor TaxID=2316720 RepID=A0A3A8QRF0_9BACT|nr:hypothetical protein D7X96_15125 [Corallococcus interemptor]
MRSGSSWAALVPLVVACAVMPGCTEEGQERPREQLAEGTAPLTGAPITSPGSISLRNALVTQQFDPLLLTPDGRLGVRVYPVAEGVWRARFTALADPIMEVTALGAPIFQTSMAHGSTVDLALPPLIRRNITLVDPQNPSPDAVLGPTSYLRPFDLPGQGALALDPRYSPSGKPFPVNAAADCLNATPSTRDAVVAPGGPFECYRLLYFQPYLSELGKPGGQPTGTGAMVLTQAEAVVVVDARRPDTTTGTVARAAAPNVVSARFTSDVHISISPAKAGGPAYLYALEASVTADARLVSAQRGIWTYNETPWNPDTWTVQRSFFNLFDDVANDVEGVRSICRHLNPTTGQPTCTATQYEDFARVYPLAARPFFLADGSRPSDTYCGYTWITPEGTDVFCRPNVAIHGDLADADLDLAQSYESGTGMQFYAFGQHTGWMIRRLDSTINFRRFNPQQLMTPPPAVDAFVHRPFSPMFLNTATGFWAENRAPQGSSLPIHRQWPLFQFMTQSEGLLDAARTQYVSLGLIPEVNTPKATNMQYWETSFSCSISPNCLLHLPMNEMFYEVAASKLTPPVLRAHKLTQDISSNTDFLDANGAALPKIHPYLGRLQNGARFVGEVYGAQQDERYLSGFRGTAISMDATGSVSVAVNGVDAPACRRNKGCLAGQDFSSGFTAEVAFLMLSDPSAMSMTLARHHGLWRLYLQSGVLLAEVNYVSPTTGAHTLTLVAPNSLPFFPLTASVATQAVGWRHVALRVAPDEGRVFLMVNGAVVHSLPLEAGAILTGTAEAGSGEIMKVGPSGVCTNCPSGEVLFMDELMFHSAAVPFEELAASAGAFSGRQDFLTPTQAETLLAGYFSTTNPRGLSLKPNGFPRFVRKEDLRVPASFSPFLQPGQAAAFRQLVAVGEALFKSPVLSTNAAGVSQAQDCTGATQPCTGELLSCATCHHPDKAFTDGRTTARGVQPVPLNVPTVVNRVFGTNQFFARRSQDLNDLALEPVVDPRELNGNLDKILERINTGADQVSLRQGFAAVYGNTPVTRTHLEQALTAYQLVQISVDSLGEAVIASGKPMVDGQGTLHRPELIQLGKELFEGKARCSACHVGSNLTDELAHDTGVAATPGAFKTPTLWEVATTAPYFHDGSHATLRQVLDFYNRGGNPPGRVRDGLRVVDPELRPLALSAHELDALEAFLVTLRNAGPVVTQGFEGLAFSDHGPIPGMVCVNTQEPTHPGGIWADNYLCAPQDRGFVWSFTGPVAGMRCTAIVEGAEPPENAWGDNYLCVPNSSPLQFTWSMAGPRFGKACVRFSDSQDVHSWGDNYLCYDEPLKLRFSAKGPIGGMACTQMNEPLDAAHGWDDNYLCANKDIGMRWGMAGPIAGMRCTQVGEDAEAASTTWTDNYLCVPPAADAMFSWSQGGPLPGLTCAQINEPEDPATWADNHLCYREEPLVLQFSVLGPLAGQVCTSVSEGSDAAGGWLDNYLCSNRDIGMQWSSVGTPPAGMRCTQVTESTEPAQTAWHDNFICLPQNSPLVFEWSEQGPIPGRTCTSWYEPSDPQQWSNNYLCR